VTANHDNANYDNDRFALLAGAGIRYPNDSMIRGLYRTNDALLGPCVRVHWSAGDAAPVLAPDVYRALRGTPPIDDLPTRAMFGPGRSEEDVDPLELA